VKTRHVEKRGAGCANPRPLRWLLPAAMLIVTAGVSAQVQPGQLRSDPAKPQPAPASPVVQSLANYQPLTAGQRFKWFAGFTFGPEALLGEAFNAGVGTWEDRPHEYGRSWTGFGERFGVGLSGDVVSNGVEAGLGAIWNEDPRYFREGTEKPVTSRMGNVFKMTFLAYDSHGDVMPAYARYIAVPGSNFLSNEWRVQSEANVSSALLRTGLGFLGRMGSNAFTEFWPDVHQHIFHR
jgi:hypothetical protein